MKNHLTGTSVTPTTTVTATDNGMIVTIRYPCHATTTDGCYVKQNTAASNRSGLSAGIWALVVLFITSAVTVFAEDVSTTSILSFDDMDSAIDTLSKQVVGDSSNFVVLIGGDVMGISDFTIEGSSNVEKRWNEHNAPLGASWTKYNLLSQEIRWDNWKPATCVQKNPGNVSETVMLVQKAYATGRWDAGFDIESGIKAASDLRVSVTRKLEVSESQWYTIPANSTGQVFVRKGSVHQAQQSQRCHKRHYGSGGIKCGQPSGPYNATLPIIGHQSWGWSTGADKMDYSSCGGIV
ncbi:hypothetical protein JCM33374_g2464 [Metschnikowia sp. JCM 33374]|nr:hypothetical protein JCM33374_g2464 [Metschnikowia sp. JCM 33374]